MAHQFLEVKNVAGIQVTTFNPSQAMRLFAMTAFCDKNLSGKEPELICEAIGISPRLYQKFQELNPFFEEWLDEQRIALGGRNNKSLLEAVGMEKALAGDFNFWKAMAIKEGAIEADRLNVGLEIPSNLGAMKEMNDDQLKALENSIMGSLRSEADAGEITLVEGSDGWERESNPSGAAQVPGPGLLADELGSDGERALRDIEHF